MPEARFTEPACGSADAAKWACAFFIAQRLNDAGFAHVNYEPGDGTRYEVLAVRDGDCTLITLPNLGTRTMRTATTFLDDLPSSLDYVGEKLYAERLGVAALTTCRVVADLFAAVCEQTRNLAAPLYPRNV